MHKFQPRIHLVLLSEDRERQSVEDLSQECHRSFVFPETAFTAVTAYQNQLV